MTTISDLPWHTTQHTNSPGADMRDTYGNVLAVFTSAVNAEYFLHSVNDYMRLHDECELMKENLVELGKAYNELKLKSETATTGK